jgi:hypothetical protein
VCRSLQSGGTFKRRRHMEENKYPDTFLTEEEEKTTEDYGDL